MRAGEAPAADTDKRLAFELLLTSFLVLFQELALIRWWPGQVRVLAYFPNLILLSAFLGLGLGSLCARRRSLWSFWTPALLLNLGAGWALSHVVFTQESATEHLYLLYYDLPPGAPVVPDIKLPLLFCFGLASLAFVPLGQALALRLQVLRERREALYGYLWDLGGSLLGVVVFAALGFSGLFPWTWFALLFAAALPVAWRQPRREVVLAAAALCLLVVTGAERAERYSPYYAIRTMAGQAGGFSVLTNGSLHQSALPLRRDAPAFSAEHALVREGYHLPFRTLAAPVRHALVIGAGTGNDVSVLLDEGAEAIDAVEIDPVILAIGRERHPDHPYASPRVRAINTDARSFLNNTRESYDLIVFGTLDSMTRLSALSNVRLDNFVYTRECLAAARGRLTPTGGLVLYFAVANSYIDMRLSGMLADIFGEVPVVSAQPHLLFNRIYMAGPAFAADHGSERRAAAFDFQRKVRAAVELPSDDWPYLYVERRGVGRFYLLLMGAIGVLAAASIFAVAPSLARGRGPGGMDIEMFLFGLGFLLLETRAVTEMNLVWGATWLTSAVVFAAILAMALAATLLARARPLSFEVGVLGVAVCLLGIYVTPIHVLLAASLPARLLLSLGWVGAPIFFAATSFAVLFRERDAADHAFGWNLLGAMLGGLIEVASMAVGLKALLLVALLAYLGALWVRLRRRLSAAAA